MSQAADVDGDGFLDLIVVNAENGSPRSWIATSTGVARTV